MYSYIHDSETGGLLLTSSPTKLSLEPRPVYAPELEMLGLNERWKFSPQTESPYMWAELNSYIYRGVKVAVLHGGDLYHAPEVEITPEGENISELLPVDVDEMCRKNEKLLKTIERATARRITADYEKYKGTADIFYVAFSGGKDSAVLLDLVKKTLPEGSFVVVFGDTGMEFPDTYKAVRVAESMCRKENIAFYRARSDFSPEESWRLFGPPARVLRWCCSVHKSAPQILTLRKILRKDNFTGVAFTGVRNSESITRSTYDAENFGKKQKGQISIHSIIKWTSAEVWLYIYKYKRVVFVNESYKKGNSRAGCLLCPMTGGYSSYVRRYNYTDEVNKFIDIIRELHAKDKGESLSAYITARGWSSRKSGRNIKNNRIKYRESIKGETVQIEIINPSSDWQEWIKTADTFTIKFKAEPTEQGFIFTVDAQSLKRNPTAGKIFKQALKKAAYCAGCRVCEANCKGGHIKFDYGQITISNCTKCGACHDVSSGCLVYNSLKLPEGEGKVKSINALNSHAPKTEWLESFFGLKDDFFAHHQLGPNMFSYFKRFLKDAGLIDRNRFTDFAELVSSIGWEKDISLGLMLINLVYNNPQFEWYVENLDIGEAYKRNRVMEMLAAQGIKPQDSGHIIYSYKRIVATPFGTVLHFGHAGDETLTRTECTITDNRVLLYALYKFAEKCNLPHEIHLPYLFDDSIDRDGPTPVRIFGLKDDDELPLLERPHGIRARLIGLSAAYPEYINAAFTNDLQTITLRDKTSQDILDLFRK